MIDDDRRLIEVGLPLEEVSAQSAREKSIRHGHISTLHIWWARRPLAACRAAVLGTLLEAPDDPAEQERLEDLIATIVDWDQVKDGNSPAIEEARRLIREQFDGRAPVVLDPFAGGGAIPLEALRLGCETHAVELNPVAHLLELCTIVYPQKYGQGAPRQSEMEQDHLPKMGPEAEQMPMAGLEDAGGSRTLAEDVECWGNWVLERARDEIGQFYENPVGEDTVVAYLWARTVRCPNPACGAALPLVRQYWLRRKRNKARVALKPVVEAGANEVCFEIVRGEELDFDPSEATVQRGDATCPVCGQTAPVEYVREEGQAGRMDQRLLAVITTAGYGAGKEYRLPTDRDRALFDAAWTRLAEMEEEHEGPHSLVADEPLPSADTLGFRVQRYGIRTWGQLFNPRQALALATFARLVREAHERILAQTGDGGYARAVATYVGMAVSRQASYTSTLCYWLDGLEAIGQTFAQGHSLPMKWDFAAVNPFSGFTAD